MSERREWEIIIDKDTGQLAQPKVIGDQPEIEVVRVREIVPNARNSESAPITPTTGSEFKQKVLQTLRRLNSMPIEELSKLLDEVEVSDEEAARWATLERMVLSSESAPKASIDDYGKEKQKPRDFYINKETMKAVHYDNPACVSHFDEIHVREVLPDERNSESPSCRLHTTNVVDEINKAIDVLLNKCGGLSYEYGPKVGNDLGPLIDEAKDHLFAARDMLRSVTLTTESESAKCATCEALQGYWDDTTEDLRKANERIASFEAELFESRSERLKLIDESNKLQECIASLEAELAEWQRRAQDNARREEAELDRAATLENERDCYRAALEKIERQDRTRGYPTGAEWLAITDLVRRAIEGTK